MKAIVVAILGVASLCIGDDAAACSFAPGYEIAKPPSRFPAEWSSSSLAPPSVSLFSLHRGFGVPDGTSCTDAGILAVLLERADPDIAGYTFELVDGTFPDRVLPEAIITPVDYEDGKRGFTFIWLDLPRGSTVLKPIDATIEVRQISTAGVESEPALLHVRDPGGSSLDPSRRWE